MTRSNRFAVPVLLAVCALGLAACGGGGDSGSSDTTATTETSGGTETTATGDVAAGKEVFASNCGSCHTLADAGTSGSVGPNLDDLQPEEAQVLAAIEDGGLGSGTMPPGLVTGTDAQAVAAYVAGAAGE